MDNWTNKRDWEKTIKVLLPIVVLFSGYFTYKGLRYEEVTVFDALIRTALVCGIAYYGWKFIYQQIPHRRGKLDNPLIIAMALILSLVLAMSTWFSIAGISMNRVHVIHMKNHLREAEAQLTDQVIRRTQEAELAAPLRMLGKDWGNSRDGEGANGSLTGGAGKGKAFGNLNQGSLTLHETAVEVENFAETTGHFNNAGKKHIADMYALLEDGDLDGQERNEEFRKHAALLNGVILELDSSIVPLVQRRIEDFEKVAFSDQSFSEKLRTNVAETKSQIQTYIAGMDSHRNVKIQHYVTLDAREAVVAHLTYCIPDIAVAVGIDVAAPFMFLFILIRTGKSEDIRLQLAQEASNAKATTTARANWELIRKQRAEEGKRQSDTGKTNGQSGPSEPVELSH